MTLPEFQKELNNFNNWVQNGCGNHGCVIKQPKGMGTNAGCQCSPHRFSEILLWLAAEIEPENKRDQFNWLDVPQESV
jgi:hypothetical protein